MYIVATLLIMMIIFMKELEFLQAQMEVLKELQRLHSFLVNIQNLMLLSQQKPQLVGTLMN